MLRRLEGGINIATVIDEKRRAFSEALLVESLGRRYEIAIADQDQWRALRSPVAKALQCLVDVRLARLCPAKEPANARTKRDELEALGDQCQTAELHLDARL